MRARQVMVHAVDLDAGVSFADLPEPFLVALADDIRAKRGPGALLAVTGSLPDVTAYLAGRGSARVTTREGDPAPDLPPWL